MQRYRLEDPTIDVDRDEPFEIVVQQPGATGYLWELAAGSAAVILERRRGDPPPGRLGASIEEVLVLRTPQSTRLSFELRAPWVATPAETRSVQIRVR